MWLVFALMKGNRVEEARASCASMADTLRATRGTYILTDELFIHTLRMLAESNRILGRSDDELAVRHEIFDRTRDFYGQHEQTYKATVRLGQELLTQCNVRAARRLLCDDLIDSAADFLGKNHIVTIELIHLYWRSLWLEHFYGDEGYRDAFQRAVKGLLYVLADLPVRG